MIAVVDRQNHIAAASKKEIEKQHKKVMRKLTLILQQPCPTNGMPRYSWCVPRKWLKVR